LNFSVLEEEGLLSGLLIFSSQAQISYDQSFAEEETGTFLQKRTSFGDN